MTYDREREDGLDIIFGRSHDNEITEFKLVEGLDGIAGKRLVIEHRQKAPPLAPKKREAKARDHHFTDFNGLASYLVRYGAPEHVVVLVDCEGGRINAALNEVTLEDAEEVSYRPLTTPDWKMVADHLNKKLTAKAFARFCRRLVDLTTGATNAELRLIAGQISVAKGLEEHTGAGTKGTFGHILRVEAKGGDGQQLQIPEKFKVSLRPFMDSLGPVELELFVDLEADEKSVFFVVDCPDAERIFSSHVDQILPPLREQLAEVKALVELGKLQRRDWRVLA